MIKSIFYFTLAFLLILILFELFLRFGGILAPIVKIDSKNGERYYPNTLSNSLFVSEGFGLSRTNSFGWFGKNISKKNNEISIAVIGNSFVASRQVFTRNNFISICENQINSSEDYLKVSIYNFGKEAMPLKELLFIKQEVETNFSPDYLIVLINARSFGGASRLVPFYELKDDSLILNKSFKQSPFFKIYSKMGYLTHSSLLFLAYRVKNKFKIAPKIIFDKFYSGNENSILKTKGVSKMINATDKAIIKKLDDSLNVIFLLDLDSDTDTNLRKLIKHSPIVDLSSVLTKLINEKGIDPYYWEISNQKGHWNNPAHTVIGRYLADELKQIIKKDSIIQ